MEEVFEPAGPSSPHYLYVTEFFTRIGAVPTHALEGLTERHKINLEVPLEDAKDVKRLLADPGDAQGVVFEMKKGWAGRTVLKTAGSLVESGRKVFFYWPREEAVEVIDTERLKSYWRLWVAGKVWQVQRPVVSRFRGNIQEQGSQGNIQEQGSQKRLLRYQMDVRNFLGRARPVKMPRLTRGGGVGLGVYLRLDFWAPIITGGSYGHTCYVAKELSKYTGEFLAVMTHKYSLLEEMGIRQISIDPPGPNSDEETIMLGTRHYHKALKPLMEYLRPAYIYERIVLGNYAGALLSGELGIPYIVEYNGSEISMKKSFGGGEGYRYEDFYLLAEEAAFRQAAVINVVSSAVKDSLVARGVDKSKILVNPNGADPDDYSPATPEEKRAIKNELGWDDSHVVVGFTGTFGGWHGVDTLAEVIPKACGRSPNIRFLMIGDGYQKKLVDKAVSANGLEDRVTSVGLVPSKEGSRLMRACDIFISPHNAHMVDSRFFGSPTKLFEYMGMGQAVIASRLEQIGEVLSPAIDMNGAGAHDLNTSDKRAILAAPGAVDQFVEGLLLLADRPDIRKALGANARKALVGEYSWERHVERLMRRAGGGGVEERAAAPKEKARSVATGDAYKDEVQNQWDNDPCGSHYVKGTRPGTLEWYKEAEAYRYGKYAPWMPEVMEFSKHAGERVLEIGGGMGTDLAQFASHGAQVTDVDLSSEHLRLARENFSLRGLNGEFIHHDAETLPFEDGYFDVVYSNGVIHHTPNTRKVVKEMFRVLRPGGRVIVMVYAELSMHYWAQLVFKLGLLNELLDSYSMGEIMSNHAELAESGAKPLVKVYTSRSLRRMFSDFEHVRIVKRQLIREELPPGFRWLPAGLLGRLVGWNLIIKADKPS